MRETFTPRTLLRQIFSREFLLLSVIAPLLKHGCQQRRHAKNLRRLCESYDVVDDRLSIVTAQTGELEWLMVNQNQHAIVGSEEGLKARFRILRSRFQFGLFYCFCGVYFRLATANLSCKSVDNWKTIRERRKGILLGRGGILRLPRKAGGDYYFRGRR